MTLASAALDRAVLTQRGWEERVRDDRAIVDDLIPARLCDTHRAVVARATSVGAHSLVLTGSTARGRRTAISDLDYHVVGGKFETRGLSAELDVHVLSVPRLREAILGGDDFTQWSIRLGRVLFDDGTLLDAARLMVECRPWPDAGRKREHARKSLDLAHRVIESGDADGAVVQVRTALSLAARAYLLGIGEFPLSRAELPAQLVAAARSEAAVALEACVRGEPSLAELHRGVRAGLALLSTDREAPDQRAATERVSALGSRS